MFRKKTKKGIRDVVVTGTALSVGAGVMGALGGDATPLSRMSKGVGIAGSVVGASMALDALDTLNRQLPKKKRR